MPATESQAPTANRSDEQIRQSIARALQTSGDVEVSGITVQVSSGHVTLEGTTDKFWRRSCAEYLAARQPGVSSVENRLVVVPNGRPRDRELAARIAASIGREARDLHVKVDSGVVTLSGLAVSPESLQDLEVPARKLRGMADVVTRVAVHPSKPAN